MWDATYPPLVVIGQRRFLRRKMMRARILCLGLLAAGALGLVPAPGTAQINIGITIGTPPPPSIVISAPPQLVVVPQTQVLYAPPLPYNYFFYSGKYYVSDEGACV